MKGRNRVIFLAYATLHAPEVAITGEGRRRRKRRGLRNRDEWLLSHATSANKFSSTKKRDIITRSSIDLSDDNIERSGRYLKKEAKEKLFSSIRIASGRIVGELFINNNNTRIHRTRNETGSFAYDTGSVVIGTIVKKRRRRRRISRRMIRRAPPRADILQQRWLERTSVVPFRRSPPRHWSASREHCPAIDPEPRTVTISCQLHTCCTPIRD